MTALRDSTALPDAVYAVWDEALCVAGQHLRDVQHACRGVALAAQTAFNIEHATEVAQHHRARAARADVRAFLVDDRRRDIAVLHREGAAEAAAVFAILHFGDRHPYLREQRAWLRFDAQLTQPGTGIVIGD